MATGKVRWYALVSLIPLAACLAEFLTGSTPLPSIVVYPPGFVFNVGLYGGGALLIREATIRWRKRWGAVLLLGGAYAVGEEGFAANTMINPNSAIIGNQAYSHWMGVNWVPLASLTVFHSVFSIAVPLLLIELFFPETKGCRLLGNVGLAITMVLYGLTVFVLTAWLGDPIRAYSRSCGFSCGLRIGIHLSALQGSEVVLAGERRPTGPPRVRLFPLRTRFHGIVLHRFGRTHANWGPHP